MSADAKRADGRVGHDIPAELRTFLGLLRRRVAHQPQTTAPPREPLTELREILPNEDLPSHFVAAAEAAGCVVHRATEESLARVVGDILASLAARTVLIEPQPGTALTEARAAALRTALAERGVAATAQRDDETLFTVDAAISGVQAAVAETGTLIGHSGPSSARGTTLIPPVHMALLAEAQIVGDLFDATLWRDRETLPANVNLITGPSKTADIEGVLVTGVHGPGQVHVVLIATRQ